MHDIASMTLGVPHLQQLTEATLDIARGAGQRIMAVYETDFAVQEKADDSPLTQADLAAHKHIVAGLHELTPDIPVLSEESARVPFAVRGSWTRYWLVDPLDGTREFVKRNGEFTVNIALIHQHRPVSGAIYAPVLNTGYHAWKGGGAWRSHAQQGAERIEARSLTDAAITVAGSRSHAGPRTREFLARVGEVHLMPRGSSLKFCLIAEGTADLYVRLGPTSEWDSAAGQCIVEESGGQVTDTKMQPLRYNTKDSLLNPEFFVFGRNHRDWSKYLETTNA